MIRSAVLKADFDLFLSPLPAGRERKEVSSDDGSEAASPKC